MGNNEIELFLERMRFWRGTTVLLVPNHRTNSLSRGFGVIYKIRSTVELANLANRDAETKADALSEQELPDEYGQ